MFIGREIPAERQFDDLGHRNLLHGGRAGRPNRFITLNVSLRTAKTTSHLAPEPMARDADETSAREWARWFKSVVASQI